MNLYNKDSLEYLKTLEDKSVDLILTDPPYAISMSSTNHMKNDDWDKMSSQEFHDFNIQWLTECYRILKDDGNLWMFCAPSKIPELFETIKQTGFINHLKDWKSLARQKGRGSKYQLKSLREDILHLTKTENFKFHENNNLFNYNENITNALNIYTGIVERPKFNIHDTVFCFKMPYYLSTTEKQIHTCQKSILLNYSFIMNYSDEGDIVLDPFMGSGSCGIATELAKRQFIGIEREKDMFDKAKNWLENFNYTEYKMNYLKGFGFNLLPFKQKTN
jgi:DNA modification methylase